MPTQLIVRNLEEELVEALRKRAARHGHSAEAEHRLILRAALMKRPARPKPNLKELILAIPKAEEAEDDEDFARPTSAPRDVDL